MTLAHGTDRLESARLVLRRVAPDDLPFFTRIHALPEVAQHAGRGQKILEEGSPAGVRPRRSVRARRPRPSLRPSRPDLQLTFPD